MSARAKAAPSRSPELSRKLLMSAAIDCFAVHGYQGASIDRIARAAGVTKGAVYYHFRDKEELLFEAVKDRIGGFENQVLRALAPSDDTVTVLRRVVDACFFHATVSNHRRFIITLMVEALDTNPRLSGEFREILRRLRGFLEGVIAQGRSRRRVRPEVDAATAAAILVGGIMGAEIQHYQDPERIDLRAVLDALVEQTAVWLAPEPSVRAAIGGR